MTPAMLIALTGHALLWGWLFQSLVRRWVRAPASRSVLMLVAGGAAAAAGLLPYSRGILGDLSLTLPLLLLGKLLQPWIPALRADSLQPPRRIALVLVMAGLGLYASALGWLSVDLYALGYQPQLLLLLLAFALLLLHRHHPELAWVGVLALLMAAWPAAHESINLWDRMLDPVLWCYCLGCAVRRNPTHR